MTAYYVASGTKKEFDSGFRSGYLQIYKPKGVKLYASQHRREIEIQPGRKWALKDLDSSRLIVESVTDQIGEFTLLNLDEEGAPKQKMEYLIPSFPLLLGCDVNRDGKVDVNDPRKYHWVWGPEGHGAILMVDNDHALASPGKELELTKLRVASTGMDSLGHSLELRLYATRTAATRFSVYRHEHGRLRKILGQIDGEVVNLSPPLHPRGETLYVAAHEYPDVDFEGLISIELHLRRVRLDTPGGVLLQSDGVVFRVAPWLALPTVFPAKKIFVCQVEHDFFSNAEVIRKLAQKCKALNVELQIIPKDANAGDIWIQDEMEIGFTQGVGHSIHAIFDSPRDRGLREFLPRLQSANIGIFQRGGSTPNSLDSFGNLEVSPPIDRYPFGRIIFGGRGYGDFREDTREMMPQLRRFLYAQKVQSPVEIFTDWLKVGHVDEIIAFVPDTSFASKKGFKILIASPQAAYALLQRLNASGHGQTLILKDKQRIVSANGPDDIVLADAQISIRDLLSDSLFWEANLNVYQEYMNLNRAILEKHLGVDPEQIIPIPSLFKVKSGHTGLERTSAYFPSMVNHLVIGRTSIVAKPYGPVINGKCQFERAFEEALPERDTEFINDWFSYHVRGGEIHCATNALRAPDFPTKWWQTIPDRAWDV